MSKQAKKQEEIFVDNILPLHYKDLNSVFLITSGLVLNQVLEISKLDSSVIHNWINRGFISRPKGKKYNIDQVARILIIDMLRPVMILEDITKLLAIINGDVEDTSDDIISDSKLYEYIYKMLEGGTDLKSVSILNIKELISNITKGYIAVKKGTDKILKDALEVIFYAYLSVISKTEAEKNLKIMEEKYL